MALLIFSFIVSCLATLILIYSRNIHLSFSADQHSGPQKFHTDQIPRIGGLSIFLTLCITTLYQYTKEYPENHLSFWYLISCSPIFIIGFTEDITKKISVKTRFLFIVIGSTLSIWLLNTMVTSVDIPGVNYLLSIPLIAGVFTIIAITGLTNAYNIIDGFNGLASMVAIITLLSIACIAFKVNDLAILEMTFVLIGAVTGFFIWNYPRGLIFLGDGGAYLIGFYIGVTLIMLINRHPEISPWYALLVNAYPIFETLFTIWRRKVHQEKNPGLPDRTHLHSILYRRIIHNPLEKNLTFSKNAKTSPYFWILSFLTVLPATIFWNQTLVLESFFLLFCFSYIWLYHSLVKFKSPWWLRLK